MGYGMNDLIKDMSGKIDKMAEAANKKKAREDADELKKARGEPQNKITLGVPPPAKPFNTETKKKPAVPYGQESLDKIQKALADIEAAQKAKPSYKTPAR
jgi:hypothetical protein